MCVAGLELILLLTSSSSFALSAAFCLLSTYVQNTNCWGKGCSSICSGPGLCVAGLVSRTFGKANEKKSGLGFVLMWDVREFHCQITLCLFVHLICSSYICRYKSLCVCIALKSSNQRHTAEILGAVTWTQLDADMNCERFLIARSFPWLFISSIWWNWPKSVGSQRIQIKIKPGLSLIRGIFAELGIN